MAKKAPSGLGETGRKLWRSVTKEVEFRPDELQVLESACAMADLITEYEKAVEDEPLTVRGSQGQPVLHPIRAEIRALRMSQATLLGKLDIPEDEEEASTALTRSQAARKAAKARWGIR